MGDLTKNFSRSEFACKCGCGFDTVDIVLINELQRLRDVLGPIKINSACRCKEHNESVGGSKKSQHLLGRAADIVFDKGKLVKAINEMSNWKGGLGIYPYFTHIDSRNGKARW